MISRMDESQSEILGALGRNIRARRAERNLSQEQLGFASGLDRTYVSGLERGKRNPSFVVLFRLAHALDLSVAEFLAGLEAELTVQP